MGDYALVEAGSNTNSTYGKVCAATSGLLFIFNRSVTKNFVELQWKKQEIAYQADNLAWRSKFNRFHENFKGANFFIRRLSVPEGGVN